MVRFDTVFPKVGGSPHPHACIIFDDLSCYRKVASKFILEGLSNNEKCIMAIDRYKQSMIAEDFIDAGVNINDYLGQGKLTILDVKESYSGNGGFNPDQTIKIWQDLSKKAVDEGFVSLRLVGEATFALGSPELADKLVYYENIINQVLFPNYPFKSLCVYDKNLYPPEIIKTAISSHPILFVNDELFTENIHYIPPEIYFKKNKARDEVDVWLTNVKRNNKNIRAVRDNEERFRSMFERAPLSYQSLDENGDFIEVNEAWLNLMGYKRYEVIGHNFSEFLHPNWKEHFNENFPRCKAVGEVLGVEFEMVKKNGSLIFVSFYGKIGRDNNNKLKQTHCILQDITKRKQAERELKLTTERFQKVFNSQLDAIFVLDNQSPPEVIEVNRAGLAMFGYEPLEIKGKTTELISAFETKGFLNDFESSMKKKDGSIFPTEHIVVELLDDAGQRNGWISVVRDVSEKKKLENRIQQVQKMESIGNMAGGIAHDFNNILFPIVGLAEMLVDDLPPGSPERINAQEILHAGNRGADLVKQILAFSRQHEQKLIPTKVQQVLKEVIKLLN